MVEFRPPKSTLPIFGQVGLDGQNSIMAQPAYQAVIALDAFENGDVATLSMPRKLRMTHPGRRSLRSIQQRRCVAATASIPSTRFAFPTDFFPKQRTSGRQRAPWATVNCELIGSKLRLVCACGVVRCAVGFLAFGGDLGSCKHTRRRSGSYRCACTNYARKFNYHFTLTSV